MKSLNGTAYFPPGITASFHGHSHLFEAMNFESAHPATILAGHGGTALDPEIPDPLPQSTSPAEGVTIESITHGSHFGLLLMERKGADWQLLALDRNGRRMATCTLTGTKVRCDRTGRIRD
jgi:hypothetical protein